MIQKIYLITHNKNKIKEFKEVLEPKIKVETIDFDYIEPKSDSCEEVVKLCLKEAYESAKVILGKQPDAPILIEDSGFFIDKLDGFPGAYTATVFRYIGNKGLLKLMADIRNDKERTIFYRSFIGFYDGKEMRIFSGEEKGTMAFQKKGDNGWGQDPIFIPLENNPENRTYGELKKKNIFEPSIFRKKALEKLDEYLNN
ncbi:MAG: non-canonical purine NTP pyrophosphatase [Candidatus Woesearchaeota archaeon]